MRWNCLTPFTIFHGSLATSGVSTARTNSWRPRSGKKCLQLSLGAGVESAAYAPYAEHGGFWVKAFSYTESGTQQDALIIVLYRN